MVEIRGEAQIDFPTIWEFKVISTSFEEAQKELFMCSEKKYELSFSKSSSGGKYVSINYKIEIESREELKERYTTLSALKSVIRVI